jgi:hypothetical protein
MIIVVDFTLYVLDLSYSSIYHEPCHHLVLTYESHCGLAFVEHA